MISDEYEEEYYIENNQELKQVELRFYSKIDRLVFAQKYDETSEFSFAEAMILCKNLKDCLDSEDMEDYK